MSLFQKYSEFYDLLYRDKDYVAEARYVAHIIRNFLPEARTILELGSGTGRHGRILASMGFDVYGIERSPEMVSIANGAEQDQRLEREGSFCCEVGDICTTKLDRSFDAVISLFHVIGYQTTNQALKAVFAVAKNHLPPGGLFLFDVWHGPAVLTQGPTERVKEVTDRRHRVKRTARPHIDTNCGTVKVAYEIECEDRYSGQVRHFSEDHLVRYLFPTEVGLLAEACGLQCTLIEEFLSGAAPSPTTWGVMYGLRR